MSPACLVGLGPWQKRLALPQVLPLKTNYRVERANRALGSDEKGRYKWRRRKSGVRIVLLRIGRYRPQPKGQTASGAMGQTGPPRQSHAPG